MRLIKTPDESKIFAMDFSPLLAGAALVSAVSVTVTAKRGSAMTAGTPSVAGSLMRVVLSGGSLGGLYLVTFTAIDSAGQTHQAAGTLAVRAA